LYLEIDEGYFEHPKTLRLCAALKDHHAAIYPIRLWKWACRSARDGKLGKVDAFVIEKVVGYEAMDGRCFSALCKGFLDLVGDDIEIHDWMSYTGGAIKRMDDKAAENRRRREDGKRRYDAAKGKDELPTVPESYRNRTGTNPSQTSPVQSSPDKKEDLSTQARARDPGSTTPCTCAMHGENCPTPSLCASGNAIADAKRDSGHVDIPNGFQLLTRFGQLRREILELQSAPGTETPKDVNGKASSFAATLTEAEAKDIEATMRLALTRIHARAQGWDDPRLSGGAFAFGAWMHQFRDLREVVNGCAPKVEEPKPKPGQPKQVQYRRLG
jgi:hypothetical protein